MGNESDWQAELASRPVFTASLRLALGATLRVTKENGEVLLDVRDDDGRLVPARMSEQEADTVLSMVRQAGWTKG